MFQGAMSVTAVKDAYRTSIFSAGSKTTRSRRDAPSRLLCRCGRRCADGTSGRELARGSPMGLCVQE
jgi:hypothetical protein